MKTENKRERVRKIKAEWTHYYTKGDVLRTAKILMRKLNPAETLPDDYYIDTDETLEQIFSKIIRQTEKKK